MGRRLAVRRWRYVSAVSAWWCVTGLLVGGCSSGGDGEESPSPSATASVSVRELCGGVFASAAGDLERMAGTREFREVGEEPAALEEFMAGLARSFEETLCLFEAQGTARSSPNTTSARVAFGWFRPESIADGYPDASLPYATGELSYSLNDATSITFPCSADGDEPYPAPYMNASFSAGSEVWDADLRMSVLNAAARVVADGLGCLEESGLVERAPQRVAGG